MPRLAGGQVESLWDEVLPIEVPELPEDLGALDVLLRDAALLQPIAAGWCGVAVDHGRLTVSMATFVRLMVVKQRTDWGYESLLVREVSDSIHLRRFCLIALGERVPDESTVRKLTRRLRGEVVDGLTRCVIVKALRETRFRARAVPIGLDRGGAGRALPEQFGADAGRCPGLGARSEEDHRAGRERCWAGEGSHARYRASVADGSPRRWAGGLGSASRRCWGTDQGRRRTAWTVAAGSQATRGPSAARCQGS
jgi:hypothetical protein